MLWEQLVSRHEVVTLPWLGGRTVAGRGRGFRLMGQLPEEHGWHRFEIDGSRRARWVGASPQGADPAFLEGLERVCGYLIGDRIVPDGVAVWLDPSSLLAQSERVGLIERGLDRFARVVAARLPTGALVYVEQAFPLGPEPQVLDALQDDREDLDGLVGVTPALHLAFLCHVVERRRVAQRRLAAAAAAAAAAAEVAPGVERRTLARRDFEAAVRAALDVSGSRLLDVRETPDPSEAVVRFAFDGGRFECVIERSTLRIVDAGICLEDHDTGEKGDRYFTLESLPGVIAEAQRTHRLVVWRHVNG